MSDSPVVNTAKRVGLAAATFGASEVVPFVLNKLTPDPGNPPTLPDTPTSENSAGKLSEAAAEQRKAKGRASTMLSSTGSSSGVSSARRTLLGS